MQKSIRSGLAPVVRQIAAFATNRSPASLEAATTAWLDLLHEHPLQMHELQNACAASLELSRAYYDIVNRYLMSAPDLDVGDDWLKVSGFWLGVESAHTWAPLVEVPSAVRDEMARELKRASRFSGEINFSAVGMCFPDDVVDVHLDKNLYTLLRSLEPDVRPNFRGLPTFSGEGPIRVFVLAAIRMAQQPGIEDWKEFESNHAIEVEFAANALNNLTVAWPELSAHRAYMEPGWDPLFALGYGAFTEAMSPFEEVVINELNSKQLPDPFLEIHVAPPDDVPPDFPLQPMEVAIEAKDGPRVLYRADVGVTVAPAFTLGWIQASLDLTRPSGRRVLTQHGLAPTLPARSRVARLGRAGPRTSRP